MFLWALTMRSFCWRHMFLIVVWTNCTLFDAVVCWALWATVSSTPCTSVSCPNPWAHTSSPWGSLGYDSIGDRSPCLKTLEIREAFVKGWRGCDAFNQDVKSIWRFQKQKPVILNKVVLDLRCSRQEENKLLFLTWDSVSSDMTHSLFKLDYRIICESLK